MYSGQIAALMMVLWTPSSTGITAPSPYQGSFQPSRSICTTAPPHAAYLPTVPLRKSPMATLPLKLLETRSQSLKPLSSKTSHFSPLPPSLPERILSSGEWPRKRAHVQVRHPHILRRCLQMQCIVQHVSYLSPQHPR